jgi:hypothetical protein
VFSLSGTHSVLSRFISCAMGGSYRRVGLDDESSPSERALGYPALCPFTKEKHLQASVMKREVNGIKRPVGHGATFRTFLCPPLEIPKFRFIISTRPTGVLTYRAHQICQHQHPAGLIDVQPFCF